MAGLRTIEEILDRDPQRFEITIIGKEAIQIIIESCYLIFYKIK